jgi:hypothetical protein
MIETIHVHYGQAYVESGGPHPDASMEDNFRGHPTPDDLIVPARAEGQRTLDGQPDYAALLAASPNMTRAELARRLGVSRAAVTQG